MIFGRDTGWIPSFGTVAKLLKLLEGVLTVFSKRALKLLDNQADFDSAIPRFESWRPSQSFSQGDVR